MGIEERDPDTPVGSGVDYKTLFLGACTLVVLLGGAAFRIWDNSSQSQSEYTHTAIERLSQRLAELEARQIECRYRMEHLEKFLERK